MREAPSSAQPQDSIVEHRYRVLDPLASRREGRTVYHEGRLSPHQVTILEALAELSAGSASLHPTPSLTARITALQGGAPPNHGNLSTRLARLSELGLLHGRPASPSERGRSRAGQPPTMWGLTTLGAHVAGEAVEQRRRAPRAALVPAFPTAAAARTRTVLRYLEPLAARPGSTMKELLADVAAREGHAASQGSTHNVLRALASKGLLSCTSEARPGTRGVQRWTVTEAGRDALARARQEARPLPTTEAVS